VGKELRVRGNRGKICGQVKFATTVAVDGGCAIASISGWLELWEKVAILTQALAIFGPLTRSQSVEIGEAAVHVDVYDASENQEFAFDVAKFESFCRGVNDASVAFEKNVREPSDESLRRLEEVHGRLEKWDRDAISKLVGRMKEAGGVELINPAGELIQVGPRKVPKRIRQVRHDTNLEMEVASRREMLCVQTDAGEFLWACDREAECVAVGDRIRVVPDPEGGLVRGTTADAAVHSGDQIAIKFDE
jgi:hypothetical protein